MSVNFNPKEYDINVRKVRDEAGRSAPGTKCPRRPLAVVRDSSNIALFRQYGHHT